MGFEVGKVLYARYSVSAVTCGLCTPLQLRGTTRPLFYIYCPMRYIWLTFLSLAVIIAVVSRLKRSPAHSPAGLASAAPTPASFVSSNTPDAATTTTRRLTLSEALAPDMAGRPVATAPGPLADSLVQFALRQLGVPYRWAGTTPESGFDCSGFLMYAYAHVGVPVPHSTALLIDAGQPVPRAEARPGDLVVFTGTAQTSTTPGHAGIIISRLGEVPLRFVHSSSARRESGVKISQVEGTDYERRFMQVRRVLSGGLLAAKPGRPSTVPAKTRIAAIVAPLEARPAAVQIADDTEPTRPQHLAPLARKTPAARPKAARASTSRKVVKPAAKKGSTRTTANKAVPKPKAKLTVKTSAKTTKPKPRAVSAPYKPR